VPITDDHHPLVYASTEEPLLERVLRERGERDESVSE